MTHACLRKGISSASRRTSHQGVGDWGNQDKETGEHKKVYFRI